MKKAFFGFIKPKLTYEAITDTQAEPVYIPPSRKVQYLLNTPLDQSGNLELAVGDQVMGGQRLQVTADAVDYALAGRSGKVTAIKPFLGMMQAKMTAVTISVDAEAAQKTNDEFKEQGQTPGLANAARFLQGLPGKPDFSPFSDPDKEIQAIVVLGVERDLLATTSQYFVKTGIESIKTGIDMLRQITGVHNVILVVPGHLVQVAGASGVVVKTVDSEYPAAHPDLIVRHVLADELNAGASRTNAGVAFFSAEAVSAIGAAFNTGRLPLEKLLSFVSKDGKMHLVSTPVGTPLEDILAALNETVGDGDRVIFGGPMTGVAVYSTEQPVQADTDMIMIQDKSRVPEPSDVACTNCGECIRVCPVNIPVNILVRLLEAQQYEAAGDQADLQACIECGLCAYVCEPRIPIFQHIKLAKHMLARMKAEESHA